MRILVVMPYYEPAFVYGGPVRSMPSLCRAMVRAGAEVSVFTTDANGEGKLDVPPGQPIERQGVRVHYFRRDWGKRFFYSAALRKACHQHVGGFDIVHSNSLWTHPSMAITAACRRANVPRIESPRGGLMPWDLHHHYWKKWAFFQLFARDQLNSAAAIHCTDLLEEEAVRALGLRAPIFVISNALEVREFSALPQRGGIRARLNLPDDALISLFVGRLSAKKGLELALAAFSVVVRRHPHAHFLIAGPDDDDTGSRMRALMAQLHLQDRVTFLGSVTGEARMAALADADLFVLSSYSENFGMAPAEALAAGIPALLSNRVGIARSVAAARAGVSVPTNAEDLASAWAALLQNPAELREMGRRGRELVQKEYDADAVARKMLDAYTRVLEEARAKPTERDHVYPGH